MINDTDNEATTQAAAKSIRQGYSHHRNYSLSTPLHNKGSNIMLVDCLEVDSGGITKFAKGSSRDSENSQTGNVDLTSINDNEIDSLLDGLLV